MTRLQQSSAPSLACSPPRSGLVWREARGRRAVRIAPPRPRRPDSLLVGYPTSRARTSRAAHATSGDARPRGARAARRRGADGRAAVGPPDGAPSRRARGGGLVPPTRPHGDSARVTWRRGRNVDSVTVGRGAGGFGGSVPSGAAAPGGGSGRHRGVGAAIRRRRGRGRGVIRRAARVLVRRRIPDWGKVARARWRKRRHGGTSLSWGRVGGGGGAGADHDRPGSRGGRGRGARRAPLAGRGGRAGGVGRRCGGYSSSGPRGCGGVGLVRGGESAVSVVARRSGGSSPHSHRTPGRVGGASIRRRALRGDELAASRRRRRARAAAVRGGRRAPRMTRRGWADVRHGIRGRRNRANRNHQQFGRAAGIVAGIGRIPAPADAIHITPAEAARHLAVGALRITARDGRTDPASQRGNRGNRKHRHEDDTTPQCR